MGGERAGLAVLVVEDEVMIAMDLQNTLEAEGFGTVDLATSYAEAEASLAADAYALVLFDLDLGGVSSLPLIEGRARAGGATIVTSGYDRAPAGTAAEASVQRLGKPLDRRALSHALAALGV